MEFAHFHEPVLDVDVNEITVLDDHRVVLGTNGGFGVPELIIWNITTGEQTARRARAPVKCLAAMDERRFVVGTTLTLKVWTEEGTVQRTHEYPLEQDSGINCALSLAVLDENRVVVGLKDTAKVWDLSTDQWAVLEGHAPSELRGRRQVVQVAVFPNKNVLTYHKKTLRIFQRDGETWQVVRKVDVGDAADVAVLDNQRVITRSYDRIVIWTFPQQTHYGQLLGSGKDFYESAVVLPDGNVLVTSIRRDEGKACTLWTETRGKWHATQLPGMSPKYNTTALRDGRIISRKFFDVGGLVTVWDLPARVCVQALNKVWDTWGGLTMTSNATAQNAKTLRQFHVIALRIVPVLKMYEALVRKPTGVIQARYAQLRRFVDGVLNEQVAKKFKRPKIGLRLL
jgi:WD40 repeat protein